MGDDTGDKPRFSVIKGGGEGRKPAKVVPMHDGLQSLQEACMEAISLGSETAIVGFALVAIGANGETVEVFDADNRASALSVLGSISIVKQGIVDVVMAGDEDEEDEEEDAPVKNTPDAKNDEEEGCESGGTTRADDEDE